LVYFFLEAGEETVEEGAGGVFHHALADTGYGAAGLGLAVHADGGLAVLFFQSYPGFAAAEADVAGAAEGEVVGIVGLGFGDGDFGGEVAPDGAHSDIDHGLVLVVAGGLEALAAGDAGGEGLGVHQGVPDLFGGGVENVGGGDVHAGGLREVNRRIDRNMFE